MRVPVATVVCLACVAVTIALGAERPAGAPASSSPSVSQIPGLGLGTQDDIDAADLAVSPQGDVHVVFRAAVRKPGAATPAYPVLYLHGEDGGRSWGRPLAVDPLGEPPRVALAAGAVHVLFGPRLRHFAGDGRSAFRELAPWVPPGRARAVAFDVLSTGSGLRVAYLLDAPATAAVPAGLELHVAGGGRGDRAVARFPASVFQQPAPALVAEGGRLHLLCAVNLEEDEGGGAGERFAQVLYLGSSDAGATWMPPVAVAGGGRAGKRTGPATVRAVALLPHQGSLYAFYSAYGLWGARSADGRAWSPPAAIAPYATSLARGSTESGSVAAVAVPSGGVLAWIDARLRKSDRRWWNPLGGLPWSDDDPFWANDDVFALDLSAVGRALAGHTAVPRRLTAPLSSARSLRAAALDGRALLLWAGRLDVGRRSAPPRRAPALFYTAFSGSPAGAGLR